MIFENFQFNKISDFEQLIKFKAERSTNVDFIDISKISESSSFEQNITRLISSMANTIGGVIFLGIKAKRKKAFQLENIQNIISINWLNFVINKNILPKINNLNMQLFENDNTKIIVIRIPRSQKAPHIASDNRFYCRNNDKTILLQEHEIRNLYTKNSKPNLEFVGVTNTNGGPTNKLGKIDFITFFPKFLIKNSGEQIEKVFKIEITMPVSLHDVNYKAMHNYFSHYDDNRIVFSISNKSPLFQNEVYTIAEAKIIVNANNYNDFENGFLEIKLFYTEGVKETRLNLKNTLIYNKQQLHLEQFITSNHKLLYS